MAKLKITKNRQLIQEIQLDQAQTYLGGRGETCQIKLDAEPGISRQHFQIHYKDQQWVLEVLSKYGELYINGEKAPEQLPLSEGTAFQVPPYEFSFGEGQISQNHNEEVGQDSNSESLDPADKTAIAVISSSSYLKLVDNKGAVRQLFRLEGEAWVAGRDVTCSIFIDNPRVSRKQFEIYREEQKYFIRDLGSANGTIVNGHQISNTEWTQLQSADVISVVDWTLHFEVHDSQFKQRIESLPATSGLMDGNFAQGGGSGSLSEDEFLPTNYSPIPADIVDPNQFAQHDPQNSYFPVPMSGPNDGQQAPPFGAPFPGYQVPPPPPPTNSSMQGKFAELKAKLNPVRVAILIILFIAVVFALMPDGQSSKKGSAKINKVKTPFDALSPEDQQYVIQCYNAAEQYLRQQLFQNALDEIIKMESKVKVYQNSLAIKDMAQNALASINAQREEEKSQQQKAELETKIQRQVEECEKIMNPEEITMMSLESCLSPVLSLSPDHPLILGLKKRADQMITDRQLKQAKRVEFEEDSKKLKALFDQAEGLQHVEKYRDAIRAYMKVIASALPDPQGLKMKSGKRIAFLQKKMETDQRQFLEKADHLMKENKFRDAVIYLQKASRLNPESEPIRIKLNLAMTELHKQMQVIFQDSILEESVGEVDAAKIKWKKIMEQSIQSEEYYEKARLKLRKYGVL